MKVESLGDVEKANYLLVEGMADEELAMPRAAISSMREFTKS